MGMGRSALGLVQQLLVSDSFFDRPHAIPVWGVWDDGAHCFAFSCGPDQIQAAFRFDRAYSPRQAVVGPNMRRLG